MIMADPDCVCVRCCLAEEPSMPTKLNEWLASHGVDAATCRAIVNPGFSDPWDPRCAFRKRKELMPTPRIR